MRISSLSFFLLFIFFHLSVVAIDRQVWKDELTNPYVVGITQDSDGMIWVATEYGLNRFDGRKFSAYTEVNSGLSSNDLNYVIANTVHRNLWIATQRDGLCIYHKENGKMQSYTVGNSPLVTNDITRLSLAKDGGIWITTYHQGVQYYDNRKQRFTKRFVDIVPALRNKKSWTSCDDGRYLYIGHVHHGLSVIDLRTLKYRNYTTDQKEGYALPGNEVTALCADGNGHCWIGTDKGLAVLDRQTSRIMTFKDFPHNEKVQAIELLKDGSLWIGTETKGVLKIGKEQLQHIRNDLSFHPVPTAHGNVRCILQDSFGNIWIGYYKEGIECISHLQSPFQSLSLPSKDNQSTPVRAIAAENEELIRLGGVGAIYTYRKGTLLRKTTLDKEYKDPVNTIYTAPDGQIWIGMNSGKIFVGEKDVYRELTGEKNLRSINNFYQRKDGSIGICSYSGIFYTDGKRLKEDTVINRQLPDLLVRKAVYDSKGNLWVGTFGRGISCFTPKGRIIKTFVTDNGFCSNAVNDLFIDRNKRIWAATRRGLVCFKDLNNYQVFDHRQELRSNYVWTINEDSKGNIWIGTNKGISQWDIRNQRFHNYDKRDGIPVSDLWQSHSIRTTKNSFYFTTTDGALSFRPENLSKKTELPPVKITRIEVFGREVKDKAHEKYAFPQKGTIRLSYAENAFRIIFNITDYALNNMVQYSYKMEGIEPGWFNTGSENEAIFRNLPPGHYTFKVRARIRKGEWNEETSLSFYIAPPIWLSTYAKIGYGMMLIGLIWLLVRAYKRKMNLETSLKLAEQKRANEQSMNEERMRFYTRIAHELRTPLTLIIGPTEDLANQQNLTEEQYRKLDTIRNHARRLLDLVNRLMDFRKTESLHKALQMKNEDLARFIEETVQKFSMADTLKGVRYETNIESKQTITSFDTEIMHVILDNLLSNAHKYTPSGTIRITLSDIEMDGNDYFHIRISDTGYGISPEALPHIFERFYQAGGSHQAVGSGLGLALVKELADLHRIKIEVTSEKGKGSTFDLFLRKSQVKELEDKIMTSSSGNTGNERQETVLVVEDHDEIRHYISETLAKYYRVITACNGEEGFRMATSQLPDMIISDIMMPIKDGLALCKELKEDIKTCHIPIVLLTAKDAPNDKKAGYNNGADSYLTKPFTSDLLVERVRNLFANRKRTALKLYSSDPATKKEATDMLSQKDKNFIEKTTAIIREYMDSDKMDIEFIADKLCMSHSTFYRKIKSLTALSANEFIRKIKLQRSAEWLQEGEMTISEIAGRAGFNSVAYFRQSFKEEYGMNPSEYQKKGMYN